MWGLFNKKIKVTEPVGFYYFKHVNFGDALNEKIMKELGIDFKFTQFDKAELVALGSIMDRFVDGAIVGKRDKEIQGETHTDKPIYVWGTGMMYSYNDELKKLIRPLDIRALRGERTRKLLEDVTGKKIRCVLADPGLLTPLYYKNSKKKYKVGIIAHKNEQDEEIFKKMHEHFKDSILIDVLCGLDNVIKQITECEYILSTSLHGIIVADSFGIPNGWCKLTDRVQGDGFKFHDYFSSFNTDREAYDLNTGVMPVLEDICRVSYNSYKEVEKKQKELIRSFPFKA